MAFNKKQHLQQNIDALRIAFTLEKEKRQATVGERLLMMQYSGFGGLKFVLNPVTNDIDIHHWRKPEHDLFPLTQELHKLLKENSEDERHYRRYVDSMKSSVLTAFYTPPQVIDAISETLHHSGITIERFLEPSAGTGSFIQSFSGNQSTTITAYEKYLPILTDVVNGTWPKEERLTELKTELAAVERKIQLSITPIAEEKIDEVSENEQKPKQHNNISASFSKTRF